MGKTRRGKVKANKTEVPNTTKDDDEYTFEDLPEERKKKYESLLEDFDKQVEDHIEEAITEMHSISVSIRNAYRVALFQLPKHQRDLNQEELVLKNMADRKNQETLRESDIFSTELAKVAENVASTVKKEVTAAKKSAKKSEDLVSAMCAKKMGKCKDFKKKPLGNDESEINFRISNQKLPCAESTRISTTPMGYGGARIKGPLTSTACSNKTAFKVLRTPDGLVDLSHVFGFSTPQSTVSNRQVMRLAKPNEMAISLNGSPIFVGDLTNQETGGVMEPAVIQLAETLGSEKEDKENIPETVIDEDIEVLAKVKSLRSHIDSMLRMKEQ